MAQTMGGLKKDQFAIGSWFSIKFDSQLKDMKHVTDVSGLSLELEPIDIPYQNLAGRHTLEKQRGQAKYGELTVKRRFDFKDRSMYEWMQKISTGTLEEYKSDGTVSMISRDGKTVIAEFAFENAWPKKWSLSDLEAKTAEPMTEEISLVIETLKRTK